jgi:hypothetical protein
LHARGLLGRRVEVLTFAWPAAPTHPRDEG